MWKQVQTEATESHKGRAKYIQRGLFWGRVEVKVYRDIIPMYFKCIVPWLLAHSQSCALIIKVNFRTFLLVQNDKETKKRKKETTRPLIVILPPPFLQP